MTNLNEKVGYSFSLLIVFIVLLIGLVFARLEYGDSGFVPQSVILGE